MTAFELRRLTPEESEARRKASEELARMRASDRALKKRLIDNERKLAKYAASVVYLIRCAGVHKIGTTTSIDVRLKTIQSMCPKPVTLVDTAPGSNLQESMLHAMVQHCHSHSEWFKLGRDDVAKVLDFMAQLKRSRQP